MRSKSNKTRSTRTNHVSESNTKSSTFLRTVNPSESFHFYEAIGKPTGQAASNLTEFLETVKTVKIESLRFHLERGDFQKWIEKTLGDTTLARRISRTSAKDGEDIRAKIHSKLKKRITELNGPILTVTVETTQSLAPQELEP